MSSSYLEQIRALGQRLRATPSPTLVDEILALTDSADPKAARYAVLALAGAEGYACAEERLLGLWKDSGIKPEMRRAVVKSLGCVGGERTLLALRHPKDLLPNHDVEMVRLHKQALLILQRRLARSAIGPARGSIRDHVTLDRLRLRLLCRNGLERQVCVDTPGARILGPGRLELWHSGPLSRLWSVRGFESFVITLPPRPVKNGDVARAAVDILTNEVARHVLTQLTVGPVRYRLAWQGEGRQNQLIWQIADQAQAHWPQLINDPRASTWEAQLFLRGPMLYVDLVPKALVDPRFAYRVADVPAASHPPLAAVLARIAGVRSEDIVWDPFVGSGTELIERGLLGPTAGLIGTDLEPRALTAAAKNAEAAGLASRIELRHADALACRSVRPSLILTNPPLGRRVARGEAMGLTHRLLEHAATQLLPGGRLVWVSPDPDQHAQQAKRLGLRLSYEQRVDMGGFPSTIQRFERSV